MINQKNREKDFIFVKNLFAQCEKTCKDPLVKEAVKILNTTFDEDFWNEENKEKNQENYKLIDPTQPFTLDWIEYTINVIKVFDFLGETDAKYSKYRKFPKNDKFVILDFSFKNISNQDDKYRGDFIIINWENQYEKDITTSVYGKYQMGYDSNAALSLKRWAKSNWYQGFDMREEDIGKWRMILEPFANITDKIEIDLSKIPVKLNSYDNDTWIKNQGAENTKKEINNITEEFKETEANVIRAIKNDVNKLKFSISELKEHSFKDNRPILYLWAKNISYQNALKEAFDKLDDSMTKTEVKINSVDKEKSGEKDIYWLIEFVRNSYSALYRASWALLDANNESIISEWTFDDHDIWMNQNRWERISSYAKQYAENYENMLKKN